jgi:hypothetical protein
MFTLYTASQVSEQIELFHNFSIDDNFDSQMGGKSRNKGSGFIKTKYFLAS